MIEALATHGLISHARSLGRDTATATKHPQPKTRWSDGI
jgi:hypothetical protein